MSKGGVMRKALSITKERLFSKEELVKAIDYGCQYQKACDYQLAGSILIRKKKVKKKHIISLLDCLVDLNFTTSEIDIKDVIDYIDNKE